MENAWNLVTLANTASSKLQASIKCYSIVFYICAYILIGSFLEIEALHLKKKKPLITLLKLAPTPTAHTANIKLIYTYIMEQLMSGFRQIQ